MVRSHGYAAEGLVLGGDAGAAGDVGAWVAAGVAVGVPSSASASITAWGVHVVGHAHNTSADPPQAKMTRPAKSRRSTGAIRGALAAGGGYTAARLFGRNASGDGATRAVDASRLKVVPRCMTPNSRNSFAASREECVVNEERETLA